jgi:hypothetical protein
MDNIDILEGILMRYLFAAALLLLFVAPAMGACISHWTFDEGAGTNAQDTCGASVFNLTASVDAWDTGVFNDAYDFSGKATANYLTQAEDFDFIQNTAIFSYAFWWYPTDFAAETLQIVLDTSATTTANKGFTHSYDNRPGSPGDDLVSRAYAVRASAGNNVYNCQTAANAIVSGKWHHIAVVGNAIFEEPKLIEELIQVRQFYQENITL